MGWCALPSNYIVWELLEACTFHYYDLARFYVQANAIYDSKI